MTYLTVSHEDILSGRVGLLFVTNLAAALIELAVLQTLGHRAWFTRHTDGYVVIWNDNLPQNDPCLSKL